ncbi:MAG: TIGR01212 family radical SAM protein [Hyphomonadaceae bacterium]|nr:TIGR01212 family radical SAM protein [Clostridia bacterium]
MEKRYYAYSDYLRSRYGEKVYKLPISIPVTCPNRDGPLGKEGCIYCAEEGTGFEMLSMDMCVKSQIEENAAYIGGHYGAKKFIAFFQNFCNTYLPLSDFEQYMHQACMPNIVAISISTRPDCVNDAYLEILKKIRLQYGIDIYIEIGLQSPNWRTLKIIERGHSLAEFIDAVIRIRSYGFYTAAHVILNLPWDTIEDCVECAKILSVLKVDEVKLHALYIMRDTKLGDMYLDGEIDIIPLKEYVERVVVFLEYLSPYIAIGRLVGRAPEHNTLFVNWQTSWWVIRDNIEALMVEWNTFQGKECDYINGKAVKKFLK